MIRQHFTHVRAAFPADRRIVDEVAQCAADPRASVGARVRDWDLCEQRVRELSPYCLPFLEEARLFIRDLIEVEGHVDVGGVRFFLQADGKIGRTLPT